MAKQYVQLCNKKGTKCEMVHVNELPSGNVTMSFDDANLILAQLYIVIGVAFVFRMIGKAIVQSY